MMMSSAASHGMRLLSDAEIALVAGGPGEPEGNEAGVDALVDRGNMEYLTSDGAFVSTMITVGGMSAQGIAFDSDNNGYYDIIWFQTTGGAWLCSMNGEALNPCSSPLPLIDNYRSNHEPHEVPEA